MEGLGVIFECEVVKQYPVEWFKDGKRINDSSNITIAAPQERVYRLTLLKTTLKNKGKYEIKINNITSDADLDVKGNNHGFTSIFTPIRYYSTILRGRHSVIFMNTVTFCLIITWMFHFAHNTQHLANEK